MHRRLLVAIGLVLPALISQGALGAEPLPPASQWIPDSAVVALEVSQPQALLDLALRQKTTEAVTSLPAYQELASQPDFRGLLAAIQYLEARLGTDWRTGIGTLLGGGVTVAASPNGAAVLIIDSKDGEMLGQLHEILVGFAKGEAEKRGEPDRVASREYGGVTAWTFNKWEEAHAIIDNRLVLANKPKVLKAVLDSRAESAGKSLATLPAYQAAKKATGSGAAATVFVNLEAVKQLPGVGQAMRQESNPMAALLLAGVAEAARESTWLALALEVQGDTLALRATVDGKVGPSGPAAFAGPSQPGQGALPNLSVPRRIAALSFYRDLHKFYAAKDDLFPERTSGLIFFENMMGIFFSGRDLTDEVLAEMQPEIRFVVAEQEYDPAIGTPEVQIPGFAAVFRLRNPEEFSEVVEEAWQKAVGLVNFTRGQQALPGVIIDRQEHGDTEYTTAYFSAKQERDPTKLDVRFNFRPALASVGDYLILSSTESLARDLIDAVQKEAAEPIKALTQTHSLAEIDLAQLASVLGANRKALVRQNMLEKAHTEQQAESEIGILLAVMRSLGRAKLALGSTEGQSEANLQLELNLP